MWRDRIAALFWYLICIKYAANKKKLKYIKGYEHTNKAVEFRVTQEAFAGIGIFVFEIIYVLTSDRAPMNEEIM